MASQRACFSAAPKCRLFVGKQGTSRQIGYKLPSHRPFQPLSDLRRVSVRYYNKSSVTSTRSTKSGFPIWTTTRVAILTALTGVFTYLYTSENGERPLWRPRSILSARPSYGSKEDMQKVRFSSLKLFNITST